MRLAPEWSSPLVMAAIVMLLAALLFYLYLQEG
jgi:hypothetical protein